MPRQLSSEVEAAVGSLRIQSEQAATAKVEREQRMAARTDETRSRQFGLAFDEIGTSQRRDTEVRQTHRWREMDSNFQYAGTVNLVVASLCRSIAWDGSARRSG